MGVVGLIEKGGGGARRSNIMDYWKTKVLPKVKKVFGKNGTKKAAAAEACKNFDDSKVINPSIFNSSSIYFCHSNISLYLTHTS